MSSILTSFIFVSGFVTGNIINFAIMDANILIPHFELCLVLWFLLSITLSNDFVKSVLSYRFGMSNQNLKYILFLWAVSFPLLLTLVRTSFGLFVIIALAGGVDRMCHRFISLHEKYISYLEYVAFAIGISISTGMCVILKMHWIGRILVLSFNFLLMFAIIYFDALDVLLRGSTLWLRNSSSSTNRYNVFNWINKLCCLRWIVDKLTTKSSTQQPVAVNEIDESTQLLSNTAAESSVSPTFTESPPMETDRIPTRYVIGCNGDRQEALRRWEATEKWRKDENIDRLLQSPPDIIVNNIEFIKKNYPHYYFGRSKLGHPVYYELLGKINAKVLFAPVERPVESGYFGFTTGKAEVGIGLSMDHLLSYNLIVNEFIWKKLAPKLTDDVLAEDYKYNDMYQSITILDVEGIKMSDLMGDVLEYIKRSISVIQAHYVGRCYKMYIVNAPFYFGMLWNIISPLLNENTRKKVTILSASELQGESSLLEFIDADQLPVQYGGKCATQLASSVEEAQFLAFIKSFKNKTSDIEDAEGIALSNEASVTMNQSIETNSSEPHISETLPSNSGEMKDNNNDVSADTSKPNWFQSLISLPPIEVIEKLTDIMESKLQDKSAVVPANDEVRVFVDCETAVLLSDSDSDLDSVDWGDDELNDLPEHNVGRSSPVKPSSPSARRKHASTDAATKRNSENSWLSALRTLFLVLYYFLDEYFHHTIKPAAMYLYGVLREYAIEKFRACSQYSNRTMVLYTVLLVDIQRTSLRLLMILKSSVACLMYSLPLFMLNMRITKHYSHLSVWFISYSLSIGGAVTALLLMMKYKYTFDSEHVVGERGTMYHASRGLAAVVCGSMVLFLLSAGFDIQIASVFGFMSMVAVSACIWLIDVLLKMIIQRYIRSRVIDYQQLQVTTGGYSRESLIDGLSLLFTMCEFVGVMTAWILPWICRGVLWGSGVTMYLQIMMSVSFPIMLSAIVIFIIALRKNRAITSLDVVEVAIDADAPFSSALQPTDKLL